MPKKDIATRFVRRYLAIKILGEAYDVVKTLKPNDREYYEDHKANKLLDIASAQAEIGENGFPAVKIATKLKIDTMDVLICARAARIAAYMGDEKLAFEFAEKASKHEGGWPFRDVANVLAERGKNPKLFLDKAAELADEYQLGENKFAGLRADNFALTAVNMHKHGGDPQPWLEKTRETLEHAGMRKSWAYNSLANAYAAIGQYTMAKALIDKIASDTPEKTQEAKQKTLIQIAYRQAKNGDIDDAVRTAYESGFEIGITIVLMKKAYKQAKKGENPSETLDRALTMAKQVDTERAEHNVTVAYSTAGRILMIAGKNPDDMFKTAMKYAGELKYPGDKSDALKHLAMDMFAAGKNSHLILDTALLEESRSPDPSSLDDILDAAIECGYSEYFNIVMGRLEQYKSANKVSKEDFSSWKVDFLIKVAKFWGEKSMSREEIAKLSKEQIQNLQKSKAPIVKEALFYFRKDQD